MEWYFNLQHLHDLNMAIASYPNDEFASPFRSTIPLLSWLKHGGDTVQQTLGQLGIDNNLSCHLEYQVAPPQGHGIASHTDLMVLNNQVSLAIEAKWTEPEYDEINHWIALGANPANRQAVLAGWLGLLEEHLGLALVPGNFGAVIYQMLHRAASACFASQNPNLAYLVFTGVGNVVLAQTVIQRMAAFWQLLGSPASFPFFVVEVPITPTQAFAGIQQLPRGNAQTAETVRNALESPIPLFDFGKPVITRIGAQL